MIQQDKYQHALRSLNSIMTRARWMAGEGKMVEVAQLLDYAEILPKYIAQPNDATAEFQATVEDISSQFECCSYIGDDFRQDCVRAW